MDSSDAAFRLFLKGLMLAGTQAQVRSACERQVSFRKQGIQSSTQDQGNSGPFWASNAQINLGQVSILQFMHKVHNWHNKLNLQNMHNSHN